MTRPAARLTSDLLARKGSAQPAAREEDLYRPGRPAVSIVELGDAKAARRGEQTVPPVLFEDPAPEASLQEMPLAAPREADDMSGLLEPVEGDAQQVAGLLPEDQPAVPADDIQPDRPIGDMVEGDVPAEDELQTPEVADEVEIADVDAEDATADEARVDEPVADDGIAENIVAVEDEATALEPDEIAGASDDDASGAVPVDDVEAVDADRVEIIDDRDEPQPVPPVVPPRPINEPSVPRGTLAPMALAERAQPIESRHERRGFGRVMTVFGLSALVGVVLAAIWLYANDSLPDVGSWFGASTPVESSSEPATPASGGDSTKVGAADAADGSGDGEPTTDAAAQSSDGAATASTGPAGTDDTAAAPAQDTAAEGPAAPAIPAPELDVVRIGEDGRPLLAGRAIPMARLVVYDNDQPIGTAEADAKGEWVFQGEERLPPGRHAFSVAIGTPESANALERQLAAKTEATVTVPERPVQAAAGNNPNPATAAGGATTARASFDAALGVYYVVQLGSLVTEADAQRLWQEISSRHPNLTESREPIVQTASQAGGGTIYRLRTGPFASRKEARDLCADFRKVGQDCLVVKRQKPAN